MGNNLPNFSIGYTRSKSLNKLNKYPCDLSIEKTILFLTRKIEKIRKINDFDHTSDYLKYELYPGQQIRRTTKFPHTAIYIYDGIILEMGSGPKKCSKNLGNPFTIREHLSGLSTLKSFEKYAKKHGVEVYKIITNKDNDKEEILARLNRLMKVVGKYEYNVISNNCLHMANFISHNSKTLVHLKNIRKKKIKQGKSNRRRSRIKSFD